MIYASYEPREELASGGPIQVAFNTNITFVGYGMIEVDACVQLGVDRMSLVQFALLLPKPSMGKAKSSIRICTFPACILLGKTLTADIGDRFCLVLVRGDFCSIAAK